MQQAKIKYHRTFIHSCFNQTWAKYGTKCIICPSGWKIVVINIIRTSVFDGDMA
jgi:hypothetical protein